MAGGQPVIHDLCLKLKIGESTTILGPNGAGKSTIVNLIHRSLYPIVKADSHLTIFESNTINIWELRSSIVIVNSDLETRFCPSIWIQTGVARMNGAAISCNQQSLLTQDPVNMYLSYSRDLEFLPINEQIYLIECLISQGID